MEKGITQTAKHTLMLDGRSRAKLTGVTAVSCFNDREVVLETGEGEVALLGENLHIEQLNLDDGQLDVTGEIAGVEYETPRKKERRGLLDEKNMTALEQARALGMMATLGAALGGIYDLMGMMRRSRAGVGASDLLFGMLCALGMTLTALYLRMNPFRLYAFAGVALGMGAYAATAGRLFRAMYRLKQNCVKKVK
ncbi:MAG: spore cortex biosynthesis protein YabQ [Christensenellales bacterium]